MGNFVAASAMTNTPFGLPLKKHMSGAVGFLDLCQALPAMWLPGGDQCDISVGTVGGRLSRNRRRPMIKCVTTARSR
jgi:hypothetical protein